MDARLRVGGPATAQAAWVAAFIAHCQQHGVPVDFVSSHVYGDDSKRKTSSARSEHVDARAHGLPCGTEGARGDPGIAAAVGAAHLDRIQRELGNHPEVTDAPFMGPWLAETIRQCDGFVQEMSYWTFSDVFDEQGVVKTPFYGGFGLLAVGGIPKPAFNAFALLHQLG